MAQLRYEDEQENAIINAESSSDEEHAKLLNTNESAEVIVKNSTKHRHGLFLTIVNLVNDDITVGLVSAPYYFTQGGVWITLATLAFYLALNAYTLQLVHAMVAKHNYHTFPEMCLAALGKPGFFAACAAIFLLNWGAQVGQLLILGTAAPRVFHEWVGDSVFFSRSYVIAGFVLVSAPIAYFKSVARLGIPALLNQIFLLAALSIIFYKTLAATSNGMANEYLVRQTSFIGTLSAVGGLSYFYVCHDMAVQYDNQVQVMHALHNCTARRWAVVAWTVPFMLMAVCIPLGLIGSLYVTASDNLLDAFDTDHITTVARYCITISILCAIPYNTFMPRIAVTDVLKGIIPYWIVKDPTIQGNRFRRNVVHVTLTSLLLLCAVLVAEFVTNLGLLFEIIGAISGVGIGLVLPPLCYLKLSPSPWTHRSNITVVSVLIIGIFSMVGCLVSLLVS